MQRAFNGNDCDCEASRGVHRDCRTLNADTNVGVEGKQACNNDEALELGSKLELVQGKLEHKQLAPEHKRVLVHRLLELEHKQAPVQDSKLELELEHKQAPVQDSKQVLELEHKQALVQDSKQVLEPEQDSKSVLEQGNK